MNRYDVQVERYLSQGAYTDVLTLCPTLIHSWHCRRFRSCISSTNSGASVQHDTSCPQANSSSKRCNADRSEEGSRYYGASIQHLRLRYILMLVQRILKGHPNIVHLIDAAWHRMPNGMYEVFILMEFCAGKHSCHPLYSVYSSSMS